MKYVGYAGIVGKAANINRKKETNTSIDPPVYWLLIQVSN